MNLNPDIFNNHTYRLLLVFFYSLFATYLAGEYFKTKFIKKGFTVTDMYKKERPILANLGGTIALVGLMIAIVLSQILVKELSTAQILIFYFIVIIHAIFGLIDDLIVTNNKIKIFAPYFMALPIALLITNTSISIFDFNIDLGLLLIYVIAPVYLLVVTNLVNMHSGFNGLASGVSGIIMFALITRSIIMGDIEQLFYIIPIFGALSVLWFYDKYPAKMIWGNIGSMRMGSAIGAYIIITGAYLFGIIILIPHIVDFFLYLISVTIKRQQFDNIKFGKLRKDGTIEAPTPLKLKFLLPYYFRLNEKQTVWILYAVTAIFCIIGLLVGV